MITYVLMVSEVFPKSHKKSGENTEFLNKIITGLKKHTLRGNYLYWKKRFKKIDKGEACLVIKVWGTEVNKKSGRSGPYHSSPVEVMRLTKKDGIGLEKLEFLRDKDGIPRLDYPLINNNKQPPIQSIAHNDGLSYEDFKEWFKKYNISDPLAIIHFQDYRYNNS